MSYFSSLSARPHLAHEHVIDIFKQIEAGIRIEQNRKKLIESNLRLVVSIAKKYQSSRVALDDLIQEGNIGLMKSIERFDWRRGCRFSTYSTWWIKQAIFSFLMNQRLIRLPAHAADLQHKIIDATASFKKEFGRDPTNDELQVITNASPTVLQATLDATRGLVSLQDSARSGSNRDGEHTYEHKIEDRQQDVFGTLLKKEVCDIVRRILHRLDPQEMWILRLRFALIEGLDDENDAFNLTDDELIQIESGQGFSNEQ